MYRLDRNLGKNANYLMTRAKESSDDDGQEFKDGRPYINKGQSNRYALKLNRETDAEVNEKKEMAKYESNNFEKVSLFHIFDNPFSFKF